MNKKSLAFSVDRLNRVILRFSVIQSACDRPVQTSESSNQQNREKRRIFLTNHRFSTTKFASDHEQEMGTNSKKMRIHHSGT